MSQLKQIDENEFSDLDNTHLAESSLTINSLTQYDYGEYSCRASNQIGTRLKTIRLNRKRKPDIPSEFKLVESTSNSAHLSWRPPEFTGDNITYVININQTNNLTSTDSDDGESTSSSIMIAELKGLQPDTEYSIKVLAFNSLGSSEFSNTLRIRTLKTTLKAEQIPKIQIAKFSDIREAICFNLEHPDYNGQIRSLRDLVIRINIRSNELTNESNSDLVKTIMVNMNKLKLGQNCISYKQLVEIDLALQKNASLEHETQNRKIVYSLTTPHQQSLQASFDSIGKNFHEFKRFNLINISVCYANDSSVCTEQLSVIDNTSDISNYVTLVAIGCSTVFIFIILLISSLCCCCCRTRNKEKKAAKANAKLKGFPIIIPNQQQQKKSSFDFTDDCIKSSQQHILNGSSSSSSSTSSTKNYYNTKANMIEQNLYDPSNAQKYLTNSYKLEYPQNTSSIATVESDVSSSISLENANNSNNNNKSSSKTSDLTTSHSPFAIITDSNTKSGFASISSSSYSNMISNHAKSTKPVASSTLVYNGGSGSMYIKAYQATQQQTQSSQYFNPKTILDNENGYSAPNNNTVSKKLVYEVIV